MKTPAGEFVEEIEVKRSRFIGYLVPYGDFRERLEALRAEHPKANHHVTAFRHMNEMNQIVEGSRDDGEPSGTSGPPALKVLQGHDLMDTAVIIVRYFGGTKLGTGGLARAYAQSAGAVIKTAKLVEWQRFLTREISAGFNEVSNLERDCGIARVEILERDFHADGVTVTITGEEQAVRELCGRWQS